jgi:hypothetical protein
MTYQKLLAAGLIAAIVCVSAIAGPPMADTQTVYQFGPLDDEQDTSGGGLNDEGDRELVHSGPVIMRKVTPEEINRIRFLELRAFRLAATDAPDRVTVKIPKKTVDDFLLEMEGHKDFLGEPSRREFRKLTPPQKLHYIAKYQGDAFIDRVKIESDPEVFLEFRKRILPTVLRGCATSGCHNMSYDESARFGLYKDPKKLNEKIYANFVLLSELQYDGMSVINRTQPDNSLLLTYMLPPKEVKESMRHPGAVELRPIFQTRAAPNYKRIERWIASLRQPAPSYGVSMINRYPTPLPAEPDEP